MSPPYRWYQHVPAATALIPCEGEQHRVSWRWGKFKLEDHDLGAERAMLVLGGQPCACLRALRLWVHQFEMPPEQFGQMQRWLGPDAVLAPSEFDVPREVAMVLNWERAWRRGAYFDKHGALIDRHLRARALPAIRAHLTAEKQRFGSRVIRGVELQTVPAGQSTGMRGRMDAVSVTASVRLSSDWLAHVWAAGLAVVDGAFVVEASGHGRRPGSVAVQVVRWEQRQPGVAEPVTVAAEAVPEGHGWRLLADSANR